VFKGGTCLAKVYAGFYRLSEDLDFTIPMPVDASRNQRRQAVAKIKNAVAVVADYLPGFAVAKPLTGTNNSTQYNGAIAYRSTTTGQQQNILIEVSVREPLLMSADKTQAMTMLCDPINGKAIVPGIKLNCITWDEAMAEKFRAALSRKEVAIRDFYDLDYAVQYFELDPSNAHMVDIVCQKLTTPGTLPVDVSTERFAALKRQLGTRLKTVLREKDFRAFDLNHAIQLVTEMAKRLTREGK